MIIQKITRLEDGKVEAVLALTEDQLSYMVSIGLQVLVAHGAAVIKTMTQEEFDIANIKPDESVPKPASVPSPDKKKGDSIEDPAH